MRIEKIEIEVLPGGNGGAITELAGTLFVLSQNEYVLQLHRLDESSVAETKTLSTPAETAYLPSGEGHPTSDGKLVFCVIHETSVEISTAKIIRIDPDAGSMTELVLSETHNTGSQCRLVRGPNNLLAVWTDLSDSMTYQWALVSSDGTSILAGPIDGREQTSNYLSFHHLTHDGMQFVAIGDKGTSVIHLVSIDDSSGALLSRWQVGMQEGEYFVDSSLAIASDGANAYVGLSPQLPYAGEQLRLQKLEPLTAR